MKSKIIIILTILTTSLVYAEPWVAPTQAPPHGNVAAPLNISNKAQAKLGGLGVANFISNGNTYLMGNVGIGTTTPTQKLEVNGTTRLNSTKSLQLVGTDHNYIEFYPQGISSGRKTYFGYPSPNSKHLTISNNFSSGGTINLVTNSGGNLTLADNGGKVGIGTTTPLSKLHVTGTIASSDDLYPSVAIKNNLKPDNTFGKSWEIINYNKGLHFNAYKSSSNQLSPGFPINVLSLIDDTGNVGVGITTPSNKLEVAGKVEADAYCDRNGGNCKTAEEIAQGVVPSGSWCGFILINFNQSILKEIKCQGERLYRGISGGMAVVGCPTGFEVIGLSATITPSWHQSTYYHKGWHCIKN